jgi:hypothetical protein
MEILRFEQAPADAPKRKKSSRSFLALGLVATLFGVSTAFASSTIAINSDNKVDLGQGVVTVSGCDTDIGFKPVTKLSADATKFQVTSFIIGYEYSPGKGLIDTTACAGKTFKVTLYKDKVPFTGVDTVLCQNTYKSGEPAGGSTLKLAKSLIIGRVTDFGNAASYAYPFKCDADGSFYFDPAFTPLQKIVQMYWPDQTEFVFDAATFDHVTIESVSGITGLSGGNV